MPEQIPVPFPAGFPMGFLSWQPFLSPLPSMVTSAPRSNGTKVGSERGSCCQGTARDTLGTAPLPFQSLLSVIVQSLSYLNRKEEAGTPNLRSALQRGVLVNQKCCKREETSLAPGNKSWNVLFFFFSHFCSSHCFSPQCGEVIRAQHGPISLTHS